MRCAGRIVVLAGMFVTLGCDSNRPTMGPALPPPPAPYTVPPIRGTIRETDGGPIDEVVQVQMSGGRTVDSDARGGFFLPYSSTPCVGSAGIGLDYSDYYSTNYNYLLPQPLAVSCTNVSPPPEVSVELKVQRYASMVVGRPFESMLTNDDLYWPQGLDGEGPCGPCKVVDVVLSSRPTTLTLDWSGPDPLRASVTASTFGIFAQQTAAAGEHQLKIQLPASPPTGLIVAHLRVGAAAGQLSDASTLRVDLR
jgi:hypothetical protein